MSGKILVEKGDRFTGIWEAVAQGNVEKVRFHLRGKVNINSQQRGFTPLSLAVEKNRPKVVDLLIANGAHYNAYTANTTPLCIAASHGYLDCGKALLKAGANPNAKCNNNNDVPLTVAAAGGHSEFVKILLQSGAAVNFVTKKDHQTALHIALEADHKKVVDNLLLHGEGIDVNLKMSNGRTALHLLVAKDDSWKPQLEVMLQKGADVNAVDNLQSTPLLTAVKSSVDNTELCRRLIGSTEIDVTACDSRGRDSLSLACHKGKAQVVELLLDVAPHLINRQSSYGTPLYYAVAGGHENIALYLLKRGADLYYPLQGAVSILDQASSALSAVLRECWETFHEGLKKALDDPGLSDVIFQLSKSGKAIHASRVILANRSEYFRHFFDSEEAEAVSKEGKKTEIIIADAEYTSFYLMLIYLYTDGIDYAYIKAKAEEEDKDMEKQSDGARVDFQTRILSDLLVLAGKYSLKRLHRLCSEKIDSDTMKKKKMKEGERKNFDEMRSTFSMDMRKAVCSPKFSDVTFAVGETHQLVPAHKVILCSRNEYFKAMLLGPWGQMHEAIPTDKPYHIFKAIMEFCYTGDYPKLDGDNVIDMYEVGHQYLILEIRRICENMILDAIGVDNVTHLYRLAFVFQDEKIKERTLEFMISTPETFRLVSARSDFLQLGKELLKEIYTRLLIKNGGFKTNPSLITPADLLELRNHKGRSPLQVASRICGMSVCVQYLLDSGADVMELVARKSHTPLHLACKAGDLLTVRVLCAQPGLNISAKNAKGDTALHIACRRGEEKIAELLVENGADLTAVNNKHESPLKTVSKVHNSMAENLPALRDASKLQFGSILNSIEFSDVVFQTESKSYYGHRVILYARCNYFEEVFADCTERATITHPITGCKREVLKVELEGIDAKVVELFLEYIYNDEVQIGEDIVYELLSLATIYPVERLQRLCQRLFEEVEIPSSQIMTELASCYNDATHYADLKFVFPSQSSSEFATDYDDGGDIAYEMPTFDTEGGSEFEFGSSIHGSMPVPPSLGDEKNQILYGHSSILAARCPRLLERFKIAQPGDGEDMVTVDMQQEDMAAEFPFQPFSVLLRYLYCGVANLPSGGEDRGLVEGVKRLAEEYQLKELIRQSKDILADMLALEKRSQFLTAF